LSYQKTGEMMGFLCAVITGVSEDVSANLHFWCIFLANAGKGKWKVKIAGLNQKNICIVNP
jgi:hypothetical protein